ncbi:hypothetical protein ccbrp13_21500 [Ktedonobacteria bacterium brp13]|nr:hypothetical protein ccbrp13_21500 [Ktedonobacteria bacterium brp13]
MECEELNLVGKSLMLTPICDGDMVAAAILDWLYLYFQSPNPFMILMNDFRHYARSWNDHNSEICDFLDELKEDLAPFDLDFSNYPNKWLTISLYTIHNAIQQQFAWKTPQVTTGDLIEALKLLHNKGYLCVEDWDMFHEDIEESIRNSRPNHKSSFSITLWLYTSQIDYAVQKLYQGHSASPPVDQRIDIKREKRIVNTQVHRARRLGQGGTLTFEEWSETLTHFKMLCAFCQQAPYEVLEHVLPIIHGGSTSIFNSVPACNLCNAIKGDRLYEEYASDFGEVRIQEIQDYLEHKKHQWIQRQRGKE